MSANELRAKCRKPECAHVWVIAYLPMDLATTAKLAGRAGCPKCGDLKPLVAKESDKTTTKDQAR